jgi:hypothetical protein|tara:strand:- start:569 stop:736 length:168 start_codon:yes stop_codon:yes gene_type:complete
MIDTKAYEPGTFGGAARFVLDAPDILSALEEGYEEIRQLKATIRDLESRLPTVNK